MRAIRSIIRGFFAIQALFLLAVPIAAILGGLKKHLNIYFADSTPIQAHHAMVAACVAVALMLGGGLIYAAAWWTSRKTEPENGIWAVAASILNFLQGVLLLLAAHLTRGRLHFPAGEGLLWIVLGAVGVYLYARVGQTTAIAAAEEVRVERKPVAGDRTSTATRHAVTVLSCIAQIVAIVAWSRWAAQHDLIVARGLVWIALVTAASVLATLIHECGHALIAWCFEMKLLSFKAGPFQWAKREGKWSFRLHVAGLLTPGGAVGAVANDPEQPRWEEILMIAAGPFANLLVGGTAIYAVIHDDWPHYAQTWELLAFTASFSVIAAALNLIPFLSEEGAYSDGARILQIITSSPLEEYRRTMARIASTATTECRYRDLDVEAIQRAADMFPNEFRGLHLQLCACHCFEDRNMIAEASAALASAEGIYDEFTIDLPAPLHTNFVIGHAYLDHDAAMARKWWDRMEAKKNDRRNVDYWLARTALLWIEGDQEGSERAWTEADLMAQTLPKFGAYEFDRYRCFLLRQALNETKQSIAQETEVVAAAAEPSPVIAAKVDSPASAPILPAWIMPGVIPETRHDIASSPGVQVQAQAEPEQSATNDYSDSASMFARLSSLTGRSADRMRQVSTPPADVSGDSTPGEDFESSPAARLNDVESAARAGNDVPLEDSADTEVVEAEPGNPQMKSNSPLADLSASVYPLERTQPVTWSANSTAPLLASTPAIMSLQVVPWAQLSTTNLPIAAQPSPSESILPKPSAGPSIPAAFARKPRVVTPMIEDPYAIFALQQLPVSEAEASTGPGYEDVPSVVGAPDSLPNVTAPVVQLLAQIQPPVTEIPAAAVATNASRELVELRAVVETPRTASEAPRFDPLAFIRAAALENLAN